MDLGPGQLAAILRKALGSDRNQVNEGHFQGRIGLTSTAAVRLTIDQLPSGLFAGPDEHARVADRGHRRYRTWGFDFDTRSVLLSTKIEEDWEESIKAQWHENHARIRDSLRHEFGEHALQRKIEDFVAIGAKPFSVLAYHNALFDQVRRAFTAGAYYPALTSACALGERILNHLVIDFRDLFKATPEYKRVYRKASFDNWELVISTLAAWEILLPDVAEQFSGLAALRHRSLHFNVETYDNLRGDALAAVGHIRTIVERQFGTFGTQPWYIEGILGASFVKRAFEDHPFVRRYLLQQSPFVGTRSRIEFDENRRARFVDFFDYGDGGVTDEEYCETFNGRNLETIATTKTSS